jgi:cytochrome c peroxidase
MRTDLASRTEYCGRFRTPTLRNVARRSVFFHNGAVTTLEKAVRFYAERDSKPARWYPMRGGSIEKFDDLPANLRANVHGDAPFGADKPQMKQADIRDIVAFLRTLDDGYAPR